jgi:hypothetical protein
MQRAITKNVIEALTLESLKVERVAAHDQWSLKTEYSQDFPK